MRVLMKWGSVMMVVMAPILGMALDIVKDGKPAATVVVPVFADTDEIKQTDQRWTEMAAGWLTNYVKKSTGADLKIVTEGAPVEGNIISIGHTKMAETAGIRIEEQKCSGSVCRLAVKGNTLYLIGRDEYGLTPAQNKQKTNYTGMGAKGTDKAVATFLEDYVGCRWFTPTPQGEYVPSRTNVSVPDNLDRTVTPVFPYMRGGPYSVACSGSIWNPKVPMLIANNYWPGIKIRSYGGHSWNSWVPINKYGKEHPEYFAVIKGKRQVPGQFGPTNANAEDVNSYLCTSNPEVKDLLLKGIRRDFDEGWDWVQLGQADGFHRCECPECEKLDNYRIDSVKGGIDDPDNPCERIFLLHKYIIDECKKSHPDKKVQLMIYGPTGTPSKKIENFGENVTGEFCTNQKYLSQWKSKMAGLTFYINHWWGTFHNIGLGPKSSPRELADEIRMFRDNKIVGIYVGGGEDWGLEGPCYYTVGRLLGNPDLNPDDCVSEYCRFVYGKAGNTMVQFFNALYDRIMPMLPTISGYTEAYPAIFTPEVTQRLSGLLAKADKQADTERAKGWLKLTQDTFDFMRLTSEMFTLHRAYQIEKTLPSLNALKDSVLKWKAFRVKLLEYGMNKYYYDLDVKDRAYIDNWYPGWEKAQMYLSSAKKGDSCGFLNQPPLALDFDALARNLKTKVAGPAKIVVPRARAAITPDNLLSADIWKETPDYPLAGLSGNLITANTKVRLMFDDQNLYVSFECEEPEVENMKLKEGKHDGKIWNNDCVEILLDPGATRSKYLHLMAVPKEGCYYDAQFGFITDPLDPTFGKEDVGGWNPDWKYAFKVDKEGKKWMLVASIPFAGLGVEAPKAGALWTANFCRERHAGKNEELSLWSPNEYSNGFCEPLDFGELYFEKSPEKEK